MHRRVFIFSSSALLAVSAFIGGVQAQTWPTRPVKMIVPYAPGGATDAVARPWADRLGQAFGQQFVVENRGGASGAIGVEAAAKSPPDGYTLLFTPSAPLSVLPHLRKTPYDPIKSFDPIGRAGDVINGFVIHPSVGVKTFAELLEYAKKNPGKLAYASSGTGTATHLRLEALKLKTGVDILHVPYRGGADSLNDLLPGNVQMMNEPVTLPHVKAGKLILLNINGSTRRPDFPDVPIWFSFFAHAGVPKDIIRTLNAQMIELAKTEEMKAALWAVNAVVPLQTPEEMAKDLEIDSARNAEIIKAGNIKME
jgi:tripartite-type tricarboxylate transporter receptor subunit TctC